MILEPVYSDYSVRLRSAKFIYWLFEGYSSVRSRTKDFIKKQILLFLITPVYPLLGFAFFLLRKQVEKTGRLNFQRFYEVEDYVEFREMVDKFQKYEPLFKYASTLDKNAGNYLYKFFCDQLLKLTESLETTNKQLVCHLEQYNRPQFKMTNSYKFVPEEHLWKERNPNYKLWL